MDQLVDSEELVAVLLVQLELADVDLVAVEPLKHLVVIMKELLVKVDMDMLIAVAMVVPAVAAGTAVAVHILMDLVTMIELEVAVQVLY